MSDPTVTVVFVEKSQPLPSQRSISKPDSSGLLSYQVMLSFSSDTHVTLRVSGACLVEAAASIVLLQPEFQVGADVLVALTR